MNDKTKRVGVDVATGKQAAEVGLPSKGMRHGAKYEVFMPKPSEPGGTLWVKAGTAWVNRDGSINVYLDVLPLDGKLHIRPAV